MKTETGWPKDGERGEFIGWDDAGVMCILRWSERITRGPAYGSGAWVGVRFDPQTVPNNASGRHLPMAFMRGPDTESLVVKHAKVD